MSQPDRLRAGIDRDVIIRDGDFDRLSPAVRALFDAWQATSDAQLAIDESAPGAGERDNELYEELRGRYRDIAAFKPASLHDAVSLLACVFLDDITDDCWGVFENEQVAALENAKAYLWRHVQAEAGTDA